MRYLIQIFRPVDHTTSIGLWNNTNWGADNLSEAQATAKKIAQSNKMGITKVRVLEMITELDCSNIIYPT